MTSVPIEEMAVLDADNMTASVGGDSSKQSLSQKIQRIYDKNRPRTAAWMQRGHSKKNDDDSSIFTSTTTSLAPYQELVTSPAALTRSIYVLRFAVFADTVNGMILQPNYAIMVSPDAHEESFPSTDPFDFSSATYFIPMTAMLGMAVASAVTGRLSDRIGRKPVILFCLSMSMVGSAVKYLLRNTFWGFCIANFFNGLLSGSLPVALAYVSDVFSSPSTKSAEFGKVVAFWVLGQSVGGMIAIIMADVGLFAPLYVGVGIMALASVVNFYYLIEPGQIKIDPSTVEQDDDEEEDGEVATELDRKTMIHILVGAFADTMGSKALFPICLSPLAFEQFYQDFVDVGEDPIMSLDMYKWMTAIVALMVIPSTLMTPTIFNKIGLAGGCVFGNFFTGILTIILLILGTREPPTNSIFGTFVAVMYLGYPFTVVSQLSTSPMLDRIAPMDQRGNVQGTYTTFLNVGNAIAPWLLGMLADGAGTATAIWTGVGISFLASLINAPLIRKKGFGPKKKTYKDTRANDDAELADMDEQEVVAKLERGEYVSVKVRDYFNRKRMARGDEFLLAHAGTFAQDEPELQALRASAKEDFTFLRRRARRVLSKLQDPEEAKKLPAALDEFNTSCNQMDPKGLDEVNQELGTWFSDYLKYSGYKGPMSPSVIKAMIMHSFPVIMKEDELSLDNFEEAMLKTERLYNNYLISEDDEESKGKVGFKDIFGSGGPIRRFWG